MKRIVNVNRRTTNSYTTISFSIGLFLLLLCQQVTYGDPCLFAVTRHANHADSNVNYKEAIICETNYFHSLTAINDFKFTCTFILDGQHRIDHDLSGLRNFASDFETLNFRCNQPEDLLRPTFHQTNSDTDLSKLSLTEKSPTLNTSDRLIGWQPSPKWRVSLISQFHYDDYPATFSPKEIMSYSEDERQGAYLQFSWLY